MVKRLAYNAGDLGLIPGSGRSSGEGNGNPLQYSCLEVTIHLTIQMTIYLGGLLLIGSHWFFLSFLSPEKASLVAQRLKRLPAMWETRVRSLGQEDLLEEEMATHSSILAWRIPWKKEPGGLESTGSQRVGHD